LKIISDYFRGRMKIRIMKCFFVSRIDVGRFKSLLLDH
jgi:hypothetical protein